MFPAACMRKRFLGKASITLITDGRDASPYVTLKPASRAACSTLLKEFSGLHCCT